MNLVFHMTEKKNKKSNKDFHHDIMKIYNNFLSFWNRERKFSYEKNLKMKNHSKWKTLGIFNSASFIIGRELDEEKLGKSLLLMLHETCNKKINHRLVQFWWNFFSSHYSNFLILAFGIFTSSITKWTSLIWAYNSVNKYQFDWLLTLYMSFTRNLNAPTSSNKDFPHFPSDQRNFSNFAFVFSTHNA